ncbi:hypothetical protein [Bacillus sp. AK031]
MGISTEIINYIADGDLHSKMKDVEHSTSLREIVTVAYMIENPAE